MNPLNSRLRLAGLVVLGLGLFFLVSPLKAQENTGSNLYFAESGPLSLTFDQLKDGLEIYVCNKVPDNGSNARNIDTSSLKPALLNFEFKDINNLPVALNTVFSSPTFTATQQVTAPQVVSATTTAQPAPALPGNIIIEPGRCGLLTFPLKSASETGNLLLNSGDYKGLVIVGSLTKNVTITVPPNLSAPFDNLTVALARSFNFPWLTSNEASYLPVSYSGSYTQTLNSLQNLNGAAPPDRFLGYLTDGQDVIGVEIDPDRLSNLTGLIPGQNPDAGQLLNLPVRLKNLKPGNYSGTLTVAGSKVKVNYQVADNIFLAVIAILIGIFLGYLIYYAATPLRFWLELRRRNKEITPTYQTALANFLKAVGPGDDGNPPDSDFFGYSLDEQSLLRFTGEIKTGLEKIRWSWLFNRDINKLTGLGDRLDQAETDAAFLGNKDGFYDNLATFKFSYDNFNNFLRVNKERINPLSVEKQQQQLDGIPLPQNADNQGSGSNPPITPVPGNSAADLPANPDPSYYSSVSSFNADKKLKVMDKGNKTTEGLNAADKGASALDLGGQLDQWLNYATILNAYLVLADSKVEKLLAEKSKSRDGVKEFEAANEKVLWDAYANLLTVSQELWNATNQRPLDEIKINCNLDDAQNNLNKAHVKIPSRNNLAPDISDHTAATPKQPGIIARIKQVFKRFPENGSNPNIFKPNYYLSPKPGNNKLASLIFEILAFAANLVGNLGLLSSLVATLLWRGVVWVGQFLIKLPGRVVDWIGAVLLLEVSVILAVVMLAALAGLNQFYFGKPFGTLSDYISILLVGTGTQLSVKALVDFLTGFNKPPASS